MPPYNKDGVLIVNFEKSPQEVPGVEILFYLEAWFEMFFIAKRNQLRQHYHLLLVGGAVASWLMHLTPHG